MIRDSSSTLLTAFSSTTLCGFGVGQRVSRTGNFNELTSATMLHLFPESTFVCLKACRRRLSEGLLVEQVVAHPRLPFRAQVYRGCPACTHKCASQSRMTLRQKANPLSCWVELCCSGDGRVRGRGRSRERRVCMTKNTYTLSSFLSHLVPLIYSIRTICITRTFNQIF